MARSRFGNIRVIVRGGKRQYEARYSVTDPRDGRRRQPSKCFPTRKQAQAWLVERERESLGGRAVAPSAWTVNMLLDHYRANVLDVRKPAKNTIRMYERAMARIAAALGQRPVQKLTPTDVQRYYGDLERAGASAWTVRYTHRLLRAALHVAVNERIIAANPTDNATLPTDPGPRERPVWTPEETQRFVEYTRRHSSRHPLWALVAETGLRIGEARSLTWADLDLAKDGSGGTLRVRRTTEPKNTMGSTTKNKRGKRTVHLTARLVRELQAHKARQNAHRLRMGDAWEDNNLVFPTATGRVQDYATLWRERKRLIERAGVPYVNIHGHRHAMGTAMLSEGFNPSDVAARLGHTETILFRHYSRAQPSQDERMAERLGEMIYGDDEGGDE